MEDNQNAEVCIVPNKVHVTGFPTYTQPQDLERIFSEYGKVKVDRITKRFATLEYSEVEEANAAIKHSKKVALYGELICVRPYYTKPGSIVTTPKREKPQIDKGRKILSPHEISLSGEFDEQLENIMMAIRLTQEEVKQITELYSDLERVLQVAWPGCRAIPFGSITTGLGVKCSDADCFINIPKKLQHANNNYIMKARRVLLANKQLFSDIVPIPFANTPIIKLYHLPSRTHCDLTFKTPLGTCNSRLIHFLLHADPRLLPLAVLLRYWAFAHGFTGRRHLTNYALTMLLLFYLQQPPVALLPPVRHLQRDPKHDRIVDHWNAGFDDDHFRLPRCDNTASIAELLGGFFQYYATFDFNEMVVSPYLGCPVKKELFNDTSTLPPGFERYKTNVESYLSFPMKITTPMCIQDPFEHSHNVACGVSIKVAIDLLTLFNFAVSAYEKEKLNGCRDFLSIILLQKPKMFGRKHATDYKCNISQTDVIAIQDPDWKSVIRDVAEVIFCQILRIPLNKGEEKIIASQKEKVTFTTKATKAVWRRKHSSKMCYLRRSDFVEKQKSMTEETIEAETQTFELDFHFEIVFTNEPRKVRVGIRYLNGDKELFREFGKFFSSIINPWYKTLLRQHSVLYHHQADHGKPDNGTPDSPNSPDSPDCDDVEEPDCDDVEEPDCDDEEPDCDDEEPDCDDEEPDGDEEEPDSK